MSDIKKAAEASVSEKCNKEQATYDQCVKRISNADGTIITGKHCTGYALELWKCIDKNATKLYFADLK